MKQVYLLNLFVIIFFSVSCGTETGTLFPSPGIPVTEPSMVIISGDLNHSGITRYDLDGALVEIVTDFRIAGGYLRGAAAVDTNTFIVSMDNADRLEAVTLDGTVQTFYGSNYLSGNIYDVEIDSTGYVYVLESNGIEVFDPLGNRDPTRIITTTVGSCVLSTPRGMTVGSNGYLYVVNTGSSDFLNIYDISTVPATCVTRQAIGQNPVGIMEHSNGYFYITRQGDDTVVRVDDDGTNLTTVWATNTTYINNPSAIIEHPSGDLIIASTATDSVERIQVDGTRVGNNPFIKDSSSLNINDIIIMQGE